MSYRPPRSVRRFLALSAGVIAVLVSALLSAGPVFAHVPPPEAPPDPGAHDMSTSAGSSGAALWTYLLVACVALLVGAAVTYGLTRSQKNHALIALDPKSTVTA